MKKIICYIKAIPFFIKSGVWCPHMYIEVSKEKAIIISTDNNFRISKNLIHRENEKVHPNATLITCKCKYCGEKELSWFDGKYEDIPVLEN